MAIRLVPTLCWLSCAMLMYSSSWGANASEDQKQRQGVDGDTAQRQANIAALDALLVGDAESAFEEERMKLAVPKRIRMERNRVCGEPDSDCLTVRYNGIVLKVSSGLDFSTHTVVDLLARLPCWFGPRRTCTSAKKEEAGDQGEEGEQGGGGHQDMLRSAFEALVVKKEVYFKIRGSELAATTQPPQGGEVRKNVLRSINPRMGEIIELVKSTTPSKTGGKNKVKQQLRTNPTLKTGAISEEL